MQSLISQALETAAPEMVAHAAATAALLRFDPIDHIKERVNEEQLRFRLLSTAVWALDAQVINQARTLYFSVRAENPGMKADIGQLIDAFNGSASNERYWGKGPALTLVQLLSLQPEWHDAACKAAQRAGRGYRPKSIDELVLNQNESISTNARENLAVLAQMVCDMANSNMDPKDRETHAFKVEDVRADLEKQAENKAVDSAKFARSILPAIRAIVDAAQAQVDDEKTPVFAELPTQTRYAILSLVKSGVDRAMSDLAVTLRSTAFALTMAEARMARVQFSKVCDIHLRELERERAEV